jgi:hypothetical protein
MNLPAQESYRRETQEFLDTCSLTEKLRAHDPLLGDRLQAIERERASLLLALTAQPGGSPPLELMERIRVLRQALATIERECTSLDDPVETRAPKVRAPRAGGALATSGPSNVPIESCASDVRRATWRRSTLRSAMAAPVPAWELAAFGLATAGALYVSGLLPALLVAAVLVTIAVASEIMRRRRPPARGRKHSEAARYPSRSVA